MRNKLTTSTLAILLLSTVSLGGCTTLNEFKVRNDNDSGAKFNGIESILSCDKPVHIVFVPGMGGYIGKEPDKIIAGIRRHSPTFKMRIAKYEKHALNSKRSDSHGELIVREYVLNCPDRRQAGVLRTFAINWGEVTKPAKEFIKDFDQHPRYVDQRLDLHNRVKQELMNNRLLDVELYINKDYHDKIVGMVSDGFDRIFRYEKTNSSTEAKYAIVAVSLGSIIAIEAINKSSSGSATMQNRMVFSLGNPIALLCFRDANPDDLKNVESRTADLCLKTVIGNFLDKNRIRGKFNDKFVAFIDPNDLLSYPLPTQLRDNHRGAFVEVSISVSRKALWIPFIGRITNPLKAHTGYANNDRVIKMIVKGCKQKECGWGRVR